MNDVTQPKVDRIDHFFSAPLARNDRWRDINFCAKAWAAGQAGRADVEAALAAAAVLEEFHAYPGHRLLSALHEHLEKDDAKGVALLARRISASIAARTFKDDPGAWEIVEDGAEAPAPDVLPPTLGAADHARPYFEMLVVTPAPVARWPNHVAQFRRLRRPEDAFVYEVVPVGSLEDAICAAVLNPDIAAVTIYEGFELHSRHDAPVLRSVIAAQAEQLGADDSDLALPPGFPIMVPGQVITQDTIDFMRKLDVKEIHGYERAKGLKLLKPDAMATARGNTRRSRTTPAAA